MATIQEIIAKRKELGANATNVEARQALMGTPTTTPVTPATPTAPVAPVTPQPIVNAPVDQNTGLSKPLEPTQPTTPIQAEVKAPEPVKTEVASTTTTPQTPFQQAQAESEKIKVQNEATMAQNKQEADLKTQERQQVAQETAQANIPKSSSEMYNLITAKSPIADELKTTSQYRVAQNRYQRASKYLTMTPTQVSNEIKNAKLIEGSEAWNDLSAMNPKLVQDATNLRNVNGNKTNIFTTVNNPDGTPVKDANGNTVKQNNLVNQFTSDYLDDYGTFLKSIYTPQTQAEVTSAIYTPEVQQAQDKATSYETEMNAIEKDIDAIEKDVEKELSGSGATGTRVRLEKIAAKEALQNEYNSVLKSYTTYANKANNLITQNTASYEKAYAQKQALNTALASAGSQKYASDLALAKNQAEFDQKLAQQAQLTNDPTTQIQSTIDEFAKLGITAQGSLASKLAEFKASGKTLPDYINGLRQQFMNKPEYKRYQAIQTGQLSEAEKLASSQSFDLKKMGISNQQDIQKLVAQYDLKNASDIQSAKIDLASKGFTTDQVDSIIRSTTGNWKGASGTTLLTAPDGTIIPSRLSETTNPNNGKECAEYVNDITGAGLGSTWDSKKKKVDSSITTPTVGDTAIWIPDPSNKTFAKYGHAGIVTASDGTNVTIKSSNLNGRGEISTVTVPISQITQTGGFANTSIKGSTTGTQSGYTDDVIAVLALAGDMTNTVEAKKTLRENGLDTQDLARFKAGTIPATAGQKTQASNVVSQIDDMLSGDALSDAVGFAKTPSMFGGTERKDFEAKFASFRDNLALSNIDKLKGAMSDKDIEFLRNTASSLNLDMSEAEFIKQLNSIKQKYSNIAGGLPANKTQSNTAPAYKPGDEDAVIARLKAKNLI